MIRLPFTGTYSLELITAQNGAQVVVCYSDKTAAGYDGGIQTSIVSSATTTKICDTPASGSVRDIDSINITNTYAGDHVVTVQVDANGTNVILAVAMLAENGSLHYTHGSGWEVFPVAGSVAGGDFKADGTVPMTGDFDLADNNITHTEGTNTTTVGFETPTANRVINYPDQSGTMALAITGSVIWYAASAAPAGYIKANGAAISRTTYATLFAAIGTTFGSGDGSTTFNVPDLRGEFIRGWDDSRGVDSARTFGSAQADAFKSHNHTLTYPGYGYSPSGGGTYGVTINSENQGNGNTISSTGGTETRPRNIALLACIKY